ncbi:caspase family protein [Tautonia sociabilis]|uniref:WD40 repeat domain-containing protein n=1 Tax=Tautonia sociabilis TaxID=2080755 RepID=A0A432MFA3_9BACT|nr:caspase family protein [Tautonia sociabilis]RUL84671.1 WD40 repeat domain-containing protein [Tautonia sociabilis]
MRSGFPWRGLLLGLVAVVVAGVGWVAWNRLLPKPGPGGEEAEPGEVAGPGAPGDPTEEEESNPDRPPQLWAVVIGVEFYGDALPDCPGASADAEAVRDWLVDRAGWPAENVALLVESGAEFVNVREAPDPGGYRPSRANLDWALRHWLPDRAGPEDLAVVYFAGRSAEIKAGPDARPWEASRFVVLPNDARPDDLDTTGFRLDEAIGVLAARQDNPILCWLDTSLSGRGAPEPGADDEGEPGFSPSSSLPWLADLTRWPGVSAWLAADGQPAAGPPESGRHSPFTEALLGGLDAIGPGGSVHECLSRMLADPALIAQGFRVQGGMPAGLKIRPGELERRLPDGPRELVLSQGHGTALTDLRFSADGSWLISAADRESSVKIWDERGDRVLRTISGATGGVRAMDVRSRDKGLLLVGDGEGYLRAFDLSDRPSNLGFTPPNLGGAVEALAILPPGPSDDHEGDRVAVVFNDDRTGEARAFVRSLDDLGGPGEQISRACSALIPAPEGSGWGFALADSDARSILVFDRQGRPLAVGDGPPISVFDGYDRRIDAENADAAGDLLAAADSSGTLVVVETKGWSERLRVDLGSRPDRLAVAAGGWVAVASGTKLRLFDLRGEEPSERPATTIDRPVVALECSPDGSWLAACPRSRSHAPAPPLLWRLDGPDLEPVPLEVDDDRPGAPWTLAFSPDGSKLAVGDSLGGLRRWELPRSGRPDPNPLRDQPPRRGQIRTVHASADGRWLVQVTQDGPALCWDLRDGRGPRIRPGPWTSGVMLPPLDGGGPRLALARKADPRQDGIRTRIELIDARTGDLLMGFAPPLGEDGSARENSWFEGLCASADGSRIAAFSPIGNIASVWDAGTGRPVASLEGCQFPIEAVDLSADGRLLLTSGGDGARLWDLPVDGSDPVERAAIAPPTDPSGAAVAITSARIRPDSGEGGPVEVALGCRDGRVLRWREGAWLDPPDDPLARLEDEVEALAFSGDGRWLAAGGRIDPMIRVIELGGGPEPALGFAVAPGPFAIGPQSSHGEQINALAFVGNRPVLVSGGEDCLVRFWEAQPTGGATLLGTLSADQEAGQWVSYTPDGLFDCSPRGADRIFWRLAGRLVPLAGYPSTHRVVGLAGRLLSGDPPAVPGAIAEPPALTIDGPADRVVFSREVELTIRLDRPDPGVVRVYQDGRPVLQARTDTAEEPAASDDPPRLRRAPEDPTLWHATVHLHSGPNRFLAMAGPSLRAGVAAEDDPTEPVAATPDGYSEPLELVYGGADPDEEGLVHVVAIGVGDYRSRERALRFASRDAEQFAQYVSLSGAEVGGSIGRCHVLTDDRVTEEAIRLAFDDVREAVRGRPQDTVILFLAGHADAIGPADEGRFVLILPEFPFPDPAPDGDGGVDPGVAAEVAAANREDLLPFAAVYSELLGLEALQRVVVIDACQAEAIRSDRSIRRIQELIDGAAFEAKTSYFLAASRQGVPAGESAELGHGLLTYAMLRGLGKPVGRGASFLPPTGDPRLEVRDHADSPPFDGYVTTDELRDFVDWALPLLADRFPHLALRTGIDGRPDADDDPEAQAEVNASAVPPTIGLNDGGFTLLRVGTPPASLTGGD